MSHLCQSCRGRSHVTDTRETLTTIRRRRECNKCGKRWTTHEIMAGANGSDGLDLLAQVEKRLKAIRVTAFDGMDGIKKWRQRRVTTQD